ncbi:MAG: lanthionine synthetase LanC family protein [Acidobacteriota bacterium]
MDSQTLLTLRPGAELVPVEDLDPSVQRRLDPRQGDHVISQPGGRTASTLVDGDTAAILAGFGAGSTLVDAVLRFAEARGLDPGEVLESCYEGLHGLVSKGVLVDADGLESEEGRGESPGYGVGADIDGRRILRVLRTLEDGELLQVALGEDSDSVGLVKLQTRQSRIGDLDREAEALVELRAQGEQGQHGDSLAPALLDRGEAEGRPYLLLEWVPGVGADVAAAELRRLGDRRGLLRLCRAVVAAYVLLHRRGWIHGDVHPRNVMVLGDGAVRLVDFGLARRLSEEADGQTAVAPRPGVAFYYEPELAAAMQGGSPTPAPSPAGEQFAVGALLYTLVAGTHYTDFGLERSRLLAQVVEEPPLPLAERGVPPWREMEVVLGRALEKDPDRRYGSMADFGAALDGLPVPLGQSRRGATAGDPSWRALESAAGELRSMAAWGGPWWRDGVDRPPVSSLYFGVAGVAYTLYRLACQGDDPELLWQADLWCRRALRWADRPDAFHDDARGLTRDQVGETSPFHSAAGIHAVDAMVARARGDGPAAVAAVRAFVDASSLEAPEDDLTLGLAGTLMATAFLRDDFEGAPGGPPAALVDLGQSTCAELWRRLAGRPPIAEDGGWLGLAHGWGGFLHATLCWFQNPEDLPPGCEARLHELARLGEPSGRGLLWRWHRGPGDGAVSMGGWCHGAAGYVSLWSLAHGRLGDPHWRDLALASAWNAWETTGGNGSLCCGLAGQAYALLRAHRLTGESLWLDRARDLAARAAEGAFTEAPWSLFKGKLALALLHADLERPATSAFPFFDPEPTA